MSWLYGKRMWRKSIGSHPIGTDEEVCPKCHGSGKLNGKECWDCKGKGKIATAGGLHI